MVPNVGDIVRVVSPYLPDKDKDVTEFSGKVLSISRKHFGIVATVKGNAVDGKEININVDFIVEVLKHSTIRSKIRFFLIKAVDFLFG